MSRVSRPYLFRRLLDVRWFFILNLVVLGFLLLSFGKEFARHYTIQQEIHRLQVQAEELGAHKLEIEQLAQAMQTEAFIEREARLKLGLRKPGEEVVVIEEKKETSTPGSIESPLIRDGTTPSTSTVLANLKKWWYYFFDHQTFESIHAYGSLSS
ncbi:MAG: putative membrane protein [Candidatus Uhrbacteria bacterium GW2011_GWF2_41_16]|uniref:Putative membrane protein n=2 Tax=Candidatus Uhriibacteriota TaxID=1752732 RepID=A0A0G0XMM9_9BACT|nr:MAG: putative membrane protein [Candidatus Uhrbacteria bacterium GW2011_GWC2_41_11]KKR98055.1 MAG: putative membrane protein [Candidatus Uhrbacteria bacterium GW2011_GWF2_41_16]HBO99678.1 hypothetical protein [Candidatus Uhrbacteria bacterium]